jgi:hypothetical protein
MNNKNRNSLELLRETLPGNQGPQMVMVTERVCNLFGNGDLQKFG